MLIGRAFLYDRLYHHHKVRAADAMAQRLIYFAQDERGEQFDLDQLYANVGDDGIIRILGGELQHAKLKGGGELSAALAKAIVERDLYHRAFVFRANFHSEAPLAAGDGSADLAELWAPISTDLSSIKEKLAVEDRIFITAKKLAAEISDPTIKAAGNELIRSQVIVDLSDNRVKPVTINVHAEDGLLEQPNLSFDPSRWSHVYDLQKRTGYVFAPRRMVSLVGLAASVVFFETWGYAGGPKGRRMVKSGGMKNDWLVELRKKGAIDETLYGVLMMNATVRLFLRADEVALPAEWANEAPDLARDLADRLRVLLPQGVSGNDLEAVKTGFSVLSSFVDMFVKDVSLSKQVLDERELQTHLVRHIRSSGKKAAEGQEFAGGETDILLEERCLIENKVDKSKKDPFGTKPSAPFQAARYARSISQRVFFTLVGYVPSDEATLMSPAASVRVSRLEGLPQTAVEIRFVVPMGLSDPSRAKAPKRRR
jgi:hypothetical protein